MILIVTLLLSLTACKHEHSFGEWSVSKNATCTEDGVKTRYCDCGEKQSDVVPATNHNYVDNACANCGDVKESPECKHENVDVLSAKEPTCTEMGLTEGVVCLDCKKTIKQQEYIDAFEHDYSLVTIIEHEHNSASGVAKTEKTIYSCQNAGCEHSYSEDVYDYFKKVVIAPTCVSQGYTTNSCSCGYSYESDYIEALGHNYTSLETAPTAFVDGYISHVCSRCDDSYSETIIPSSFTVTSSNRNQIGYTGANDENLVIPAAFKIDGIWYRVTAIEDDSFEQCTNLKSVQIPASVENISRDAFTGCDSLANIMVDKNNVFYKSIDGNLYSDDYDGLRLLQYAIGKTDKKFEIPEGVISIRSFAFSGCTSIESIKIPASVVSIGGNAFFCCPHLENIIVDEKNTVYRSIDGNLYNENGTHLFRYAPGKDSITFEVPAFVECVCSYAFSYCEPLMNITFEEGSNIHTISHYTFFSCSNLISITVPSNLTNIENGAFVYCYSLLNINYEGMVEQWNKIAFEKNWDMCTGNYTIYCTDGEIAKDGTLTYYEEEKSYVRDGDYIYFGEYPQTIKADDVTITETQDSRGYYLGSDGSYYARVIATPYEAGYTFSTGATVTSETVYYFKVEPIRWRILSEKNGEAFLLCDSIISNHRFDDNSNYYANSEIRAWLNSTFYETAFSELARSLIITVEVEHTNNKVFLLSQTQVTNSSYGFSYDSSRFMLTSDYSRANGASMSTSLSYYGNGRWWLCSINTNTSYAAHYVLNFGSADSSTDVSYDFIGIVPALRITL